MVCLLCLVWLFINVILNRLERIREMSVLYIRVKLFLLASQIVLFVLSLNPIVKLKYAFEWWCNFNSLVTTVRHALNTVTHSFK